MGGEGDWTSELLRWVLEALEENRDSTALPVIRSATEHLPQEGDLDCIGSLGSSVLSPSRLSSYPSPIAGSRGQSGSWEPTDTQPPLPPPTRPPPSNPLPMRLSHQLDLQNSGQGQRSLPEGENARLDQGSLRPQLGPLNPGHQLPRTPKSKGRLSAAGTDGDRQELGLRISSLRNVSHHPSHFQLET